MRNGITNQILAVVFFLGAITFSPSNSHAGDFKFSCRLFSRVAEEDHTGGLRLHIRPETMALVKRRGISLADIERSAEEIPHDLVGIVRDRLELIELTRLRRSGLLIDRNKIERLAAHEIREWIRRGPLVRNEEPNDTRDLLKLLDKPERHRVDTTLSALDAANNVYNLPEAEHGHSAREMIARYETFLRNTPLGYRVNETLAEPMTGLKLAYYTPEGGSFFNGRRPRILAIGGTEGIADVLADLHLGYSQSRTREIERLGAKVLNDLEQGHEVVITGHSLGGGVAQKFAYEIQLAMEGKPFPGKLRLVTWNSFGAKEMIAWGGGKGYDPKIGDQMDAVNYFVPGDLVSMVGTHVGELRALKRSDETMLSRRHSTDILQASVKVDSSLRQAKVVDRYQLKSIAILSSMLGGIGDMYQRFRYRLKLTEINERILAARLSWVEKRGLSADDWLVSEIEDARLYAEKHHITRLLLDIEAYEKKRDAVLKKYREFGDGSGI